MKQFEASFGLIGIFSTCEWIC